MEQSHSRVISKSHLSAQPYNLRNGQMFLRSFEFISLGCSWYFKSIGKLYPNQNHKQFESSWLKIQKFYMVEDLMCALNIHKITSQSVFKVFKLSVSTISSGKLFHISVKRALSLRLWITVKAQLPHCHYRRPSVLALLSTNISCWLLNELA